MKQLKNLLFLLAVMIGAAQASGQESSDSTKTKRNVDVMFGVGGGVTKFLGDIEDGNATNVHLFGNRAAYDVHLGVNLSRSFTLYLNGIYGKLSGNENTTGSNRNFETEMFQAGLGVEYNFAGLYKDKLPVVSPFLNVGGYYSNYFNIATDLEDLSGQPYYYWSDGRIRDQPESVQNETTAENMVRDFKYETSLINGSIHSFAASAGGGLDLHLSRAFSIRFMSRYFFSFTDRIDGFDDQTVSKWNDGFFHTSISLVINTTALDPNRADEEPIYDYLFDFSKIENEDEDGDGVKDLKDLCAFTPKDVKVDKKGCPLDSDLDGIPDYKDKDVNSPEGSIVDQSGVPVNYELVATKTDSGGIFRVHWDKRFITPRDPESEVFTVNVGSKESDLADSSKRWVLTIPELSEQKINDSLTVFYLGSYQMFNEAEARSQELRGKGINSAYSVIEDAADEVSDDMVALERVAEEFEHERDARITAQSLNEANTSAKAKKTSQKSQNQKVKVTSAPVKPEFEAVDKDGDGLITANEIERMLEGILEGDTTYTTEDFNAIATYYTEFTENADPIDFRGTKVVYVDGVMTILKTEDGEMSKDSRRLLARKYTETDFNGDGELSPEEVQQMIHMFRMGESPYSDERIHELIDLFFD